MSTTQGRSAVERFLIAAAAVAVIIVAMAWGAELILPLVIIIYTTALVMPLYEWMVGKGFPKWLAVTLLIFLLLGIFVGLFLLVYYSFSRMRSELGDTENQLIAQLNSLGISTDTSTVDGESVGESVSQLLESAGGIISGFLGNIIGFIAMGFVILVGVALILLDTAHLRTALSNILNRGDLGLENVARLPGNLVSYFVARTQINLITGTMVTIFLLFMRIP